LVIHSLLTATPEDYSSESVIYVKDDNEESLHHIEKLVRVRLETSRVANKYEVVCKGEKEGIQI
jgi:hypothetical protein